MIRDSAQKAPTGQREHTIKFCNKDIHGHDETEEDNIKLDNMRVKVRKEYERRHNYPAKIQWRFFTRTVGDRVTDSIHMLRAWYANLKTALVAMEERPLITPGVG